MEGAAGGKVQITISPHTGLAVFVAATPEKPIPTFADPTASPEERSRRFLDTYGEAFGISARDQVLVGSVQGSDEVGMEHVRFQQVHQGVLVQGGEVIVHLRGAYVTAVLGNTRTHNRT
jgi:Zn-dependent metalloprotease